MASRSLLLGLVVGAALVGAVWLASVLWSRSARDYDECLVTQRGNVDACDAIMRMRGAAERLKR